jgi:primosomal replication protein N
MTRLTLQLRTLSLALAVSGTLFAAVPASAAWTSPLLTYSGYLRDASGKVVTTATTITFRFYSVAEGGTAVWEDAIGVVPSADGYFSAIIGATESNPLLPSDFLAQLWLGLQVSTDVAEMTPRTRLTSVPYALAVDWAGVTGKPATFPADPTVVQARVTGTCGASQFMQSIDEAGAVVCATPAGGGDVTDVLGGSGVVVSNPAGPQPTVSLRPCAAGQVLKSDGTAWACAADADTDTNSGGDLTAVMAGSGIQVAGGTGPTPTVAVMSCSAGQLLRHNGATWGCASEASSYVQNQSAAVQAASFNIGGSGALAGDLVAAGDGLFGTTLAAGYTTPQGSRLAVKGAPATTGAGTVTVFSGNANVTGAGTTFLSSVRAGDYITVSGFIARRVVSVASNLSLTVENAFTADQTGRTYSVQPSAAVFETSGGTQALAVDALGHVRIGSLETHTYSVTSTSATEVATTTSKHAFCAVGAFDLTTSDTGTHKWCAVEPNADGTWRVAARAGAATVVCKARCF